MERTSANYKNDRKVVFGCLGTSIASLGVAGDWGGPNTRLVLWIEDCAREKWVRMAEISEVEWKAATNKLPIPVIIGEGTNVRIGLEGSFNPDLTVCFREVRRGRRGG